MCIHDVFSPKTYSPGMKRSATACWMLFVAGLIISGSARADVDRVRGCTSPAQAHELLIQQKFIAPFRALGEAVRSGQGDAVGVQLCRLGETFIYDITMLGRDGRVNHTLVNARTGVLMPPAKAGK